MGRKLQIQEFTIQIMALFVVKVGMECPLKKQTQWHTNLDI